MIGSTSDTSAVNVAGYAWSGGTGFSELVYPTAIYVDVNARGKKRTFALEVTLSNFRVLQIDFQVLRTDFQVLRTDFQVLQTDFQVLQTDFQVLRRHFCYFMVLEPT